MNRQDTRAEVASLKTEHSSLEREIADWRQWWAELKELGRPQFGEMGDRLAQFREHLASHFAHEESQKALNLVENLPPETVRQLAKLRDEHGGLLEELDRLIERLQACKPQFDCWSDARKQFDAFLTRLDTHESAEEAAYGRLK
jgi:chromosome segregation ATPase